MQTTPAGYHREDCPGASARGTPRRSTALQSRVIDQVEKEIQRGAHLEQAGLRMQLARIVVQLESIHSTYKSRFFCAIRMSIGMISKAMPPISACCYFILRLYWCDWQARHHIISFRLGSHLERLLDAARIENAHADDSTTNASNTEVNSK